MWRFEGCAARWESRQFRACIDLARPEQGLVEVAFQSHLLSDASLMQMHLPTSGPRITLQLQDCYARGADLIATYADGGPQTARPEFYWRIRDEAPSGPVALESLVSTQTQLLDSNAEVSVWCVVPSQRCHAIREPNPAIDAGQELLQNFPTTIGMSLWGCALVFQISATPLVFGQIVDPSDRAHAGVWCNREGRLASSRVSYFRGRMEKGVIRRARLRGFLAQQDCWQQVLTDQWQELLHAPPPLAT